MADRVDVAVADLLRARRTATRTAARLARRVVAAEQAVVTALVARDATA